MKKIKFLLLTCTILIIQPLHGSLGLYKKGSALRLPLDEKARRYAARYIADIKTIADIEKHAEQLTKDIIDEKPEDYYPKPLIEELKNEIRSFYLDAKMTYFIQQAMQECNALTTTLTSTSDSDELTEQFKEKWHIPNNALYQPITSSFYKEIEKLIKRRALTRAHARVARTQANLLSSTPITLQDLKSAIQNYKMISTLPDEADHQYIYNIFRDTLKLNMLQAAVTAQTRALELSMQKSATSTRTTALSSQDIQDLYQAEQENFFRTEQSLWQELLRAHYDEKLHELTTTIPLTTLPQDQLDELLKQLKNNVINDVQFFDLSPALIQIMHDHLEKFFKKIGRNKTLSSPHTPTVKRAVSIHDTKNVVINIPGREEINNEENRSMLLQKIQHELHILLHDHIIHPVVPKRIFSLILEGQQPPITLEDFLKFSNIPNSITNKQLEHIHDKIMELSHLNHQSKLKIQHQTTTGAMTTALLPHQQQEQHTAAARSQAVPSTSPLTHRFLTTKKNILALMQNVALDQRLLDETLHILFARLIQKNITIEQFIADIDVPEAFTEKDFDTIDHVINRFEHFNQEVKEGKTAKTVTPAFAQQEK